MGRNLQLSAEQGPRLLPCYPSPILYSMTVLYSIWVHCQKYSINPGILLASFQNATAYNFDSWVHVLRHCLSLTITEQSTVIFTVYNTYIVYTMLNPTRCVFNQSEGTVVRRDFFYFGSGFVFFPFFGPGSSYGPIFFVIAKVKKKRQIEIIMI